MKIPRKVWAILAVVVLAVPGNNVLGFNPAIEASAQNASPAEWPCEFGLFWDEQAMGVRPFWEDGNTGAGVTIAILDTGVDNTHPAFQGRVLAGLAQDFNTAERDCDGLDIWGIPVNPDDLTDCSGHGTHVAGIAAANGNTTWGPIQGIAYEANILPLKVTRLLGIPAGRWDHYAIAPGQSVALGFGVAEYASYVDAWVVWESPSNNLEVTLQAPDGRPPVPLPLHPELPSTRYHTQYPTRRGRNGSQGEWQLIIQADSENPTTEVFDARIDAVGWTWHPSDVTDAIYYAIEQSVDVINLSLGGPEIYDDVWTAIDAATEAGITVVVAAGNTGCLQRDPGEYECPENPLERMGFPALHPRAITVGAHDQERRPARFSTCGPTIPDPPHENTGWIKPDLLAPGGQTDCEGGYTDVVCSTMSQHSDDFTYPLGFPYYGLAGTSMAAPQVSGLAALLIQRYRDQFQENPNQGEIAALLQDTAVDENGVPRMAQRDNTYGAGVVSARRAFVAFPFHFPAWQANTPRNLEVWLPDYIPHGLSFIPLKGTLYWHSPREEDYFIDFGVDGTPGTYWDESISMAYDYPTSAQHVFSMTPENVSLDAYLATTYPPDIGQDVHGYYHSPLEVQSSVEPGWWVYQIEDIPVGARFPLHVLVYWDSAVSIGARLFLYNQLNSYPCRHVFPTVASCVVASPYYAGYSLGLRLLDPHAELESVSVMTSYRILNPGGPEFWPIPNASEVYLPLVLQRIPEPGAQGTPTPPAFPSPPLPTPYPVPPTPTPGGPPAPTPTPSATPADDDPPVSSMDPLAPFQPASAFGVAWSGYDVGSSGIRGYDVQVRVLPEPGLWSNWLSLTPDTSAIFEGGQDGHRYEFRCRAWDNAWNHEPFPLEPETATTVDLTPPSSQVNALPSYNPRSYTVSWTGEDATSGVARYDLQVCTVDCQSPGSAIWTDWLTQTTSTSRPFTGDHGVTYSFRSRARDNAGNVEPYPELADTFTTVDGQPPDTAVEAMALYTDSTSFPVRWDGSDDLSGLDHYDIYVRDESEASWGLWLEEVTITETVYTGTPGHTHHFCSRGVDVVGNQENCPPACIEGDECAWPIVSDAQTGVVPWSRADDLPPNTGSRTFIVSWSGSDDVQVYDVQVRDGRFGTWQIWQRGVAYTSAPYTGEYSHVYYFRSRGSSGGTWELYPYDYDSYTKLVSPTGLERPLGPPQAIPPDEAPDWMEEVTQTHPIGVPLAGFIAPQSDVDWYRFELTRTVRLRVSVVDLPADYDLYLFDGSGRFLWASTWGYNRPEEIVVRAPAGVYYVRLVGYAGAWSGDVPYNLLVERERSAGGPEVPSGLE